jgi:hypothetical protein
MLGEDKLLDWQFNLCWPVSSPGISNPEVKHARFRLDVAGCSRISCLSPMKKRALISPANHIGERETLVPMLTHYLLLDLGLSL